MKHSIKDWVFATRPWSLTASAMPALIGISYVFYVRNDLSSVNWLFGVLSLFGAVIFQSGSNLLNDYFDYKYNVDRKDSHSSRTLVDEIFTPKEIFNFALSFFATGSLLGIYLLINTNWELLVIGLLGGLGGFFYNKFKNIALGDIVIYIIYGVLISFGTVYVMTGILMWEIIAITTPAGFLIVGILHANNTRDIINDGKANIKTLAMLIGLKNSKIYFILLMFLPYLCIIGLSVAKIVSPLNLAVILTLPMAYKCIEEINSVDIENLNKIKTLAEKVAKLVLMFCFVQACFNFIAGSI